MKSNTHRCFLLIALEVIIATGIAAQDLKINEVVSANVWGITDEDGEHEDWIELYNTSSSSINLNGYGISDDPTLPFRWIFPSVNILPGHHLLIFASGKDRTSPNLHTNFKVKSSGESLSLTHPSGVLMDSIETGYVPSDISRGRQPDGTGALHYFANPTPDNANTTAGYLEMAEAPAFSIPAGFFSGSQSIQMFSSSPSAQIRYTLDGSPPTETSQLYTSPININQTTSIRARCFDLGYLFSDIATSSYINYDNHGLAVVSLVTDPDNFFDPQIGIYINYLEDWERPVHIEFFEPDGSLGFSENGGVKTYGRASLMFNDQKSLALFARDKYNCESFDHRLFEQKPFIEFKSFVLRSSGNDWSSTMIRDGMLQTLVENTDIDIQAYRPSIMFLNGEYYGIHNVREKQNDHYLEANHGVNPDSVDMLEDHAVVIRGSADHYNAMINFIETHNMSLEQNYEYIKTQMDITEYIQYEITEIYYANTDWPGLNIKFWRPQTPDGIWRWLLFDLDYGFGRWHGYDHNTLEWATDPSSWWSWWNPPWSTFLLRSLLENDTFSSYFINYFADFMNYEFDSTRVDSIVDVFVETIAPEMPNHISRWNLGSMNTWYDSLDVAYEFARMRPSYMYDDILHYFNLTATADISLNVNPPTGGRIQIHSKVPDEYPWTGIYFQGVPLPLTALPEEGYRFVNWTGAALPDSESVILNVTGNTSITAIFEADSTQDNPIVINEINYNSASDFDTEDWLEFYNNSSQNVDLSNWIFKDSDDSNAFFFPANTILETMGFLVLCRDTAAFSILFPAVTNILGNLNFNLSNGGELIRLYNANGEIVDSLTYDDEPPWPPEPDGQGPTLELLDPDLPNYNPANWRASILPHGSPGSENGWTGINVSLTPYGVPIQISASGGSFDFNVSISNNLTQPETFDVWIMVELPNGNPYGPVLGPVNLTLPGGYTANRDRTQNVPAGAPAGMYDYIGYVGNYPDSVFDYSAFDFEKLAAGDGFMIGDWDNYGESFEAWITTVATAVVPDVFTLGQNYPNPFNPVTELSYIIPSSGEVSLTIFDIQGREVDVLFNGRQSAGAHRTVWDASKMASGVYFARLRAEGVCLTRKILLVK